MPKKEEKNMLNSNISSLYFRLKMIISSMEFNLNIRLVRPIQIVEEFICLEKI